MSIAVDRALLRVYTFCGLHDRACDLYGRGAPQDLKDLSGGALSISGPRWAVVGLSRAAGPDFGSSILNSDLAVRPGPYACRLLARSADSKFLIFAEEVATYAREHME